MKKQKKACDHKQTRVFLAKDGSGMIVFKKQISPVITYLYLSLENKELELYSTTVDNIIANIAWKEISKKEAALLL